MIDDISSDLQKVNRYSKNHLDNCNTDLELIKIFPFYKFKKTDFLSRKFLEGQEVPEKFIIDFLVS